MNLSHLGLVLLLGTLTPPPGSPGASDSQTADEPKPTEDRARLRRLAERFLAGDEPAGRELIPAGARGIEAVEDVFTGPEAERRLQGLVEAVIRAALKRSLEEEEGLVYHGQFNSLRGLGSRGARVLLEVFRDEDEAQETRARAANALGDLGDTSLLPELHAILEDFLTEAWVGDAAGFLMARLGDRSYVDQLVREAKEVISQVTTTRNLPSILAGHTTLAEVYYRTEDYPQAIKHYEQKQAIVVDLMARLRKELQSGLERELALLLYNKACSLSLAGRIDEAFASLDQALPHPEITLEMIAADGDLRGVRADPRYQKWRTDREQEPPEVP